MKKIGMVLILGRRRFIICKVNKKTIIAREFKQKIKNRTISMHFLDKYEFPNDNKKVKSVGNKVLQSTNP